MLLNYLWPRNAEPPPATRIDDDDVPHIGDDPLPFSIDGARAYLVASDDALVALLRRCTYEGCTPVWRRDRHTTLWDSRENVFRCPCCGSAFLLDGTPAFGPAPSPLHRLVVTQHSDGDVFISLPKVTPLQRLEVRP